MASTTPEQQLRAWLAVVRAYNRCDAVLGQLLGERGYSIAQYEVLSQLHSSPGLTQQELAKRSFVAKSGMSMLIKRLEEDGWVRRESDAQDARMKRLHLTELGLERAEEVRQVQTQVVSTMAGTMTGYALLTLTDQMDRVHDALLQLRRPNTRSDAT